MYDAIIVGGGAAGLMAAVVAAERGRNVLLLEKMDQAGRKLRITGKGRCNLTNTNTLKDTLPHIGSDPRFLRNAYGRFFNHELMEFFERKGVELKVERGNRVYPASDKALDIFLALVNDLEKRSNVTIRKNCAVKAIETYEESPDVSQTSKFEVQNSKLGNRRVTAVILQNGERIACRHILLATGGLSYPTTGSTGAGYRMAQELGHTVVEPVASLVPMVCEERIPKEAVGFLLKNVTLSLLDGERSLFASQVGEMTFVDDGIAGPLTLSASRIAARPLHEGRTLTAVIDLKPGLSREQLDRKLISDLNANGTRIFNDALRLWLPAELIPLALHDLHIEYYKRLNQINGEERRRLAAWLKGVRLTVTGTHDFNEAIITQGGVSLKEVNPKTMESRLISGLFLAGELLDLDADTGGYNLQIAFSTGHAAGEAL